MPIWYLGTKSLIRLVINSPAFSTTNSGFAVSLLSRAATLSVKVVWASSGVAPSSVAKNAASSLSTSVLGLFARTLAIPCSSSLPVAVGLSLSISILTPEILFFYSGLSDCISITVEIWFNLCKLSTFELAEVGSERNL